MHDESVHDVTRDRQSLALLLSRVREGQQASYIGPRKGEYIKANKGWIRIHQGLRFRYCGKGSVWLVNVRCVMSCGIMWKKDQLSERCEEPQKYTFVSHKHYKRSYTVLAKIQRGQLVSMPRVTVCDRDQNVYSYNYQSCTDMHGNIVTCMTNSAWNFLSDQA